MNVYKIVDFQLPLFQGGSGPFIAVTVGGIIPLLYLLLLPFLDRSDKLHPLDRMVHTVIIIWLITVWLIIYAIWGGALTPGLPIPPIRVAEVTLIPTAIILAGMAFVYATWKGPKPGNMKQPTLREIAVKRAYATLVLAFLVAVEVIITAALWKVLPDGSFEPMIGVLVGAGLVVFGEIIALYRYIAYPPKPGRSK